MAESRPISVIIPTRHRAGSLRRTLESVATQGIHPAEIIVCDASTDLETKAFCEADKVLSLRWIQAQKAGAAVQRNQAFLQATQPFILFMDDDVLLEPDCLSRLWAALQSDPALGGVNAMITNQSYHAPGWLSRIQFRFLHGGPLSSYAGQWLGGVFTVLPEDREGLPEIVPMQWLNTTCTLYRREALPVPLFPDWFHGYSIAEDLLLSLEVQKRGWKVANARTARLFHDSQGGVHKSSQGRVIAMEISNGWRIGSAFSGLSKPRLAANFLAVQFVKFLASLSRPTEWNMLLPRLWGNATGWWRVIQGGASPPA